MVAVDTHNSPQLVSAVGILADERSPVAVDRLGVGNPVEGRALAVDGIEAAVGTDMQDVALDIDIVVDAVVDSWAEDNRTVLPAELLIPVVLVENKAVEWAVAGDKVVAEWAAELEEQYSI